MDLGLKPQHAPDYRLEVMGEEMLIYHPSQTKVVYCNATAALVWQLCDGTLTAAQLIDLLAKAYPEAGAAIPAQVSATLERFLSDGVITVA
ncbi:MAG: PqqD family protein [Chloroflexi bacterium]|nr:PqqD family protein [Chloroflexota bacterium]